MTRARGVEVLFLAGETPTWHMHVCGLVLVDRPVTRGEAIDVLGQRLHVSPQSRWKLRAGRFVDDPDFDLANHVHQVTLPPPGGATDLGRLVGEIAAENLDRRRPLWETWVVDGMADGRGALITKMHHALVDGVSGTDLTAMMMDLEPGAQPVPGTLEPPAPGPSFARIAAEEIGEALARPVRAAGFARQLARQAVVAGRHLARGTNAALPVRVPRTPLNGVLSVARDCAWSSVDLADARAVKERHGVKLNDVVLSLVGGALRGWLIDLDRLPDRPMVAEVPVSLRTAENRHDVGTRVGTMFVSLGTHLADPVARLEHVAASALDAKALRQELRGGVSMAELVPPQLIGLVTRAYTSARLEGILPPFFNVIVSNVPGPPVDLYLCGARVEAIYPIGPLLYGSGLNVTALSFADRLDFGLLTCPDLVRDPWAVADRIPKALAELLAA